MVQGRYSQLQYIEHVLVAVLPSMKHQQLGPSYHSGVGVKNFNILKFDGLFYTYSIKQYSISCIIPYIIQFLFLYNTNSHLYA